jgi:hypothetical protein
LGAALVAAQSRITLPPQKNSNVAAKRPHVATLRSSDTSEGSRVALSSDQSLNDYEAYRRGDRFYVKIPGADVSRADAVRGKGFADVKAQRTGDSTVVSFRLQPGATARVEQRSNRLDVVFTVAGASPSAPLSSSRASSNSSSRDVSRQAKGNEANRNSNTSRANVSPSSPSSQSLGNKNSADRSSAAAARNTNNSNQAKANPNSSPAANTGSKPLATPVPSPAIVAGAKTPAQTPTPKTSSSALASPTTQATPAGTQLRQQDRWGRMKERINYWILLAQLNPLPVAIGVVVLLLLFGLFLFQRRRAKSPRRVRSSSSKATKRAPLKDDTAGVKPPEPKPAPEVTSVSPIAEAAAIAGVAAVASKSADTTPEVEPAVVPEIEPARADDSRRERNTQATEEARKVTSGASYDESMIGSDDHETRKIVGAELLSAMVGRSEARRDLARTAFIKHGYFDDATRDLRIADSPNERAAAARRLSFVNDREATPHLVGALDDPSPDVRRTAVEALMDLRDPAAIGPLNALMQTENDRKVPRTIIKQAIEACATAAPDQSPLPATPSEAPASGNYPSSPSIQTEREVIEL